MTSQKPLFQPGRHPSALSRNQTIRLGQSYQTARRAGLSLLEVVIALAVLVVSVSLLGQLLDTARVGAFKSALETEALIHAESLLAETVIAETTPEEVHDQPIDEAGEWTYSLTTEPGEWTNLLLLTLVVQHRNPQGILDAEVTLNRWLMLPPTSTTSSSTFP